MSDHRPSTTPLSKWPRGWLIMEVAGIIGRPEFMLMDKQTRENNGYPDSDDALREFILRHRGLVGGKEQ